MSISVMGFSTKLKADCVELINEELDSIPIDRLEEFDLIARELQDIISPPSFISSLRCFFCPAPKKKSPLSAAAQEQLGYVRFCFDNPQEYVKLKADYAEYQQIIKDRITAKIAEFQTFNASEKRAYIQFQEEKHPELNQKLL
jgi:hypothetical protein